METAVGWVGGGSSLVGVKVEGGQRRRWGGGGRGGGRGGGTALPEISSDVKFTERTVDGNDEMEIDRE